MLQKINIKAIINSIWLGLFIGLVLQVYLGNFKEPMNAFISIVVSGIIGFLIGGITEVITAMLPISLAKPSLYFLLNGLIAFFTTIVLLVLISMMVHVDVTDAVYGRVILTVLIIVLLANIVDWLFYVRTNRKLNHYKSTIKKDH